MADRTPGPKTDLAILLAASVRKVEEDELRDVALVQAKHELALLRSAVRGLREINAELLAALKQFVALDGNPCVTSDGGAWCTQHDCPMPCRTAAARAAIKRVEGK